MYAYRSPGGGKGYRLQYCGLENSMDCVVHGVAKSWTRLSNFHIIVREKTLQKGADGAWYLRTAGEE